MPPLTPDPDTVGLFIVIADKVHEQHFICKLDDGGLSDVGCAVPSITKSFIFSFIPTFIFYYFFFYLSMDVSLLQVNRDLYSDI